MRRPRAFGQNHKTILDMVIERVRHAKVERLVPLGTTLLDLGCGYEANLLKRLSPRLEKGWGIDVRVRKQVNRKITLLEGSVNSKLDLASDSVGTVTALAVIEHVDDPRVMLREAYRVLKPGGILVLTTPHRLGQFPLELMARLRLIDREEIADHKRYYSAKDLREEIMNAGFDVVEVRHFGFGYLNLLATARK